MAAADPGQAQANANAAALVQASGGKITWSQLATLTAIAEVQSGGADIEQTGDTPAQLGQPGVGFGPWQVTPWTSADGAPNLQDAALAAWSKFQTQGYGAWELNSSGTALGSNDQGLDPAGYVPTAAQFQRGAAAASSAMGAPANLNTPANQTVIGAATAAAANQASLTAAEGGSTTGSLLGNCNGKKNYINFPSVVGIGGGGLLTQCNVKALLSFMLIASGSLLGLAGALLLFDRSGKLLGKSTGRAAELAGAGIGLVPGGEAVGGAVMSAGHKVSKAAGSKAPAKQRPKERSDKEQDIYAQGVAAGQPRSQPLRPRQNSGPGARFQDMTGPF